MSEATTIDEHDLTPAQLAQDVDGLQGDALRGKVRDYIAVNGVSQSSVATLSGNAESTFSAWLKGTFRGQLRRGHHNHRI